MFLFDGMQGLVTIYIASKRIKPTATLRPKGTHLPGAPRLVFNRQVPLPNAAFTSW